MLAVVGRSSFEGTRGPGSHQKERGHMYPNSALPAWQLLLMMVVTVALLVTWIIVVRLADGQPRGCSCEGEGAAAEERVRATQSGDQRAV